MKFFNYIFHPKNTSEKVTYSDHDQDQPNKDSDVTEESFHIPMVEFIERETQQGVLRGTKKRFMESHDYNLMMMMMMKERLPDENLLWESFKIGSLSKTKVSLIYLQNKANSGIVSEIKERIKDIKAEIVLDSSYIERNIENSNLSPFPQLETTQRPDVAESALSQGRVVILTDGCPDA